MAHPLLQKVSLKSQRTANLSLYTDLLERLDDGEISYAADVMLVCGDASPEAIAAEVKKIRESGKTVLVQKGRAGAERCAEVIVLGGEV